MASWRETGASRRVSFKQRDTVCSSTATLMEGFLLKRPVSHKFGSKRRRLVRLLDDRIVWSKGASDKKPLGFLELEGAATAHDRQRGHLTVYNRTRTLVLAADPDGCADDLEVWGDCISNQLRVLRARATAREGLLLPERGSIKGYDSGAVAQAISDTMMNGEAVRAEARPASPPTDPPTVGAAEAERPVGASAEAACAEPPATPSASAEPRAADDASVEEEGDVARRPSEAEEGASEGAVSDILAET